MTDHPPQRENRGGGAALIGVLLLLVLLPLLYVLSTGPVLRFALIQGWEEYESAVNTFYWPLSKLTEWFPPLGSLLGGYVEWWVKDLFPP